MRPNHIFIALVLCVAQSTVMSLSIVWHVHNYVPEQVNKILDERDQKKQDELFQISVDEYKRWLDSTTVYSATRDTSWMPKYHPLIPKY